MNHREVKRRVRRECASLLRMVEASAVYEWMAEAGVPASDDEYARWEGALADVTRRLDPEGEVATYPRREVPGQMQSEEWG